MELGSLDISGKCFSPTEPSQKASVRATEMDCQLRALAALAEDMGSVPNMHMAAHSHPKLLLQETGSPLLASVGIGHSCGMYSHIQANTHRNKIK